MQTEERESDDGDEAPEVVDVLRYETSDGAEYRLIEAGRGEEVVAAHEDELRAQWVKRGGLAAFLGLGIGGLAAIYGPLWLGTLGVVPFLALAVGIRRGRQNQDQFVPEVVEAGATRYRAEERFDVVEE